MIRKYVQEDGMHGSRLLEGACSDAAHQPKPEKQTQGHGSLSFTGNGWPSFMFWVREAARGWEKGAGT
jgi:hypothetical protein